MKQHETRKQQHAFQNGCCRSCQQYLLQKLPYTLDQNTTTQSSAVNEPTFTKAKSLTVYLGR
jgi:hypothetical protein